MTLATGWRPVGKYMPQVAAAASTDLFNTDHSVTGVANPPDVRIRDGLEKARPSGSGIELRARFEERQSAKAAAINAVLMIVQEYPTKWRLRAVFEQNVAFVPCQRRNYSLALHFGRRPQVKGTHELTHYIHPPPRAL